MGVKKVLRVRINSGIDYRMEAARKDLDLDSDQALKRILKEDKERDQWAQSLLGVSWSDPSFYDVAFNLDCMSLYSVVETIEQMSKREEFTVDESTISTLLDLTLRSRIWAALFQHKKSWALQVSVTVKDGQVTLYGDVVSSKLAVAIRSIVEGVEGVGEVADKINIGAKWLL